MTKRFCDCCGKKVLDKAINFSYPCHLTEPNFGDYIDADGESISGRNDNKELCRKCSNLIFLAALDKFNELHKCESECEYKCAPTDNGIKELDTLCTKYNTGEISLCNLVCQIWNTAYCSGEQHIQKKH